MRDVYSLKIQLYLLALGLSLVTEAFAHPFCRKPLHVIATHDMTPFREYRHPLLVAADPAGNFVASARPFVDDRVKVTPLRQASPLPYDKTIPSFHAAPEPEPELVERGVTGTPVVSLTVSPPDSLGRRQIAIADDNGHVDAFDAATGNHLYSTAQHPWPVTQMQYFNTPNGQALFTAGGKAARIWDAENGLTLRGLSGPNSFAHNGFINGIGVLNGPRPTALTISQDGTARRWNLGDLTEPGPNWVFGSGMRHPGPVEALQTARIPSLFATGDATGGISVWNGARLPLLQVKNDSPVTSLDFSADGQRIFSVGQDGIGKVWNTSTGGNNVILPTETYGNVSGGYLIRNGQYALTFHDTGKVVVWDVQAPRFGRRHGVPVMEYEGNAPVDGLKMVARRRPGENTRFLTTDVRGNLSIGEIPPISR